MVYGRRRQGKSYLLRRLTQATGGFYHQALELETAQALEELGERLGAHLGVGPLALRSWSEAIGMLTSLAVRPGGGSESTRPAVAVLDEFPYHLEKDSSLPSIIQRLVDNTQEAGSPPVRLILCGSALSVMEGLLGGALRGRIKAQVVTRPFSYPDFASFWGVRDARLAFRLHAVVGATPGYKNLVRSEPKGVASFDRWVLEEILSPSSALFNEEEFLLGEERTLTDRSLYHSVLAAVASGSTSEAQIAAAVGRVQAGVQHPLRELVRTGFIVKDDDMLRARRPIYRIADPIIRFHQVVKIPDVSRFEDRQGEAAWKAAQPRFESQVLGPHLEVLVREWLAHRDNEYRPTRDPIGRVGSAVVNDPQGRTQHEVDVVALAPGSSTSKGDVRIIGEVKLRELHMGDLERLERVRKLIKKPDADLLLASATGFDEDLEAARRKRSDVVFVTLADLLTQ